MSSVSRSGPGPRIASCGRTTSPTSPLSTSRWLRCLNSAETGFLQRTKPETVGFALADSPAGQAAWIYEKFQSKTDNHGLAEDAFSTDDMLDAISLYWYTNSAASSGRIYWENESGSLAGLKLTLPVAVTVFPRDIPRLPRSWIEDTYSNLVHYGEANEGGHFAAFEQPEILVSEIRTGLRSVRS